MFRVVYRSVLIFLVFRFLLDLFACIDDVLCGLIPTRCVMHGVLLTSNASVCVYDGWNLFYFFSSGVSQDDTAIHQKRQKGGLRENTTRSHQITETHR